MSHLRNLFHKRPEYGYDAERAPAVPVAGKATAPSSASSISTCLEFPAEQAHISSANRLVFYADPRSPAADRFRFLRMRLREQWSAGKLKTLLITSPLAQDGKSTVMLNLATALSDRGKRSVLVIEADLHHSRLAEDFKIQARAGLTECLQDVSISPLSCVRRLEPLGWHLFPAGEPRQNPTDLLQTPALGPILQKLSECFDWVLIDSPPVLPLTDALALQQHADGSLLVVRAGRTPREAVKQAVEILGPNNIVGIVLNGVERRNQLYYQQGYYQGARHHED